MLLEAKVQTLKTLSHCKTQLKKISNPTHILFKEELNSLRKGKFVEETLESRVFTLLILFLNKELSYLFLQEENFFLRKTSLSDKF